MLIAIILASVLITSILSGILGMAGGMVLMAVLVSTLSVSGAMLLHGVVQATSNGSRAWFLRAHLRFHLLPVYLLGSALSVGLFSWFTLVPDPAIILILIGSFAWLARLSKRLRGLDITHTPTNASCGFLVTSAQLFAGASGPLLDVFYLSSPLSRQEIVANKALTQTIGHLLKIFYYGVILNTLFQNVANEVTSTVQVELWVYVVAAALAILGARIGTRLLDRWNDAGFAKVSQAIILTIATICMAQGVWLLFTG